MKLESCCLRNSMRWQKSEEARKQRAASGSGAESRRGRKGMEGMLSRGLQQIAARNGVMEGEG